MPAANRNNPWRIQPKPVPVPYDKTAKIAARSLASYKTQVPSPHDAREEKYRRRQSQLTSQGYFAAQNVPYKGLGDPFYLDEQRMILHALGQWDAVSTSIDIFVHTYLFVFVYELIHVYESQVEFHHQIKLFFFIFMQGILLISEIKTKNHVHVNVFVYALYQV